MKQFTFPLLIIISLAAVKPNAEQPVPVANFRVDTSLYVPDNNYRFRYAPGPGIFWNEPQSVWNSSMFVWAFRKKHSDEVDVYSYRGKCGTSVVPAYAVDSTNFSVLISCYFVDSDPQWESIVEYADHFILFDHDGTEMLRDTGMAGFGFDGSTTYLVAKPVSNQIGLKTWQLRTNVASASPAQPLAKKNAGAPEMMQIYGMGGGYKVTLSPAPESGATFQLFDLLGRSIFTKKIESLSSPVSFSIPEGDVPGSPFVAKSSAGNGTTIKKILPVKR
jgi:hypothetical protein